MKHYFAREVLSSGRKRIDVSLDGEEVATFYPSRMGARTWQKFQDMVRADGDMLTMRDGSYGYDVVGKRF